MKKQILFGIVGGAILSFGQSGAFAQKTLQPLPPLPPGLVLADDPSAQVESAASAENSLQPGQIINEPAGANNQFDNKNFLKQAAHDCGTEVKLAQLGVEKAQDPALKQAAKELLANYSNLGKQLKELATKRNVVLSEQSDSQHLKYLAGLSGEKFDKAFATIMNQRHQMEMANLRKAVGQEQDTEMCLVAKNGLAALEPHSSRIQNLAPENVAGIKLNEAAGAQLPEKRETPADDGTSAEPESPKK